MLIEDRIYGACDIDSSILIELIQSPAIQRLKRIGQLGVPEEYYHLKGFSRYEHSIGVMLLLKRLGANEEEQVSGLLHDASHLAFSHVADFLLGTESQENWQDLNHSARLEEIGVRPIIERHGLSFERIANCESFGLLERAIPDLCADRIDYALRELPIELVKSTLDALEVEDGRIVFTDVDAAAAFALAFLERQKLNWGSVEAVNRYSIFSKALKIALREGLISFDDLKQDDDFVLEKIKGCQDPEFLRYIEALHDKTWTDRPVAGQKHLKKLRYVDPLCRMPEGIRRLSEADTALGHVLMIGLDEQRQGVPQINIDLNI